MEYIFDGEDYEYDIEAWDIDRALLKCDRKILLEYIENEIDIQDYKEKNGIDIMSCNVLELVDMITERNDFYEYFEGYLFGFFERKARAEYIDDRSCQMDIAEYNGVKQSDFI